MNNVNIKLYIRVVHMFAIMTVSHLRSSFLQSARGPYTLLNSLEIYNPSPGAPVGRLPGGGLTRAGGWLLGGGAGGGSFKLSFAHVIK